MGGAELAPVILVFPRRDHNQVRVDLHQWVGQAVVLLTEHFGATEVHDADPDVLLVVSTANHGTLLDPARMSDVRAFVHRFGRTYPKLSTGVVVGSTYHHITKFDPGEFD